MRLDHLLSKDSDEPTVHNLRSVIWLSFALSSFEGASDTRKRGRSSLLFTENCTEETRKSKTKGDFVYSCHKVFLTEVFYRKVEKNRIDFPEESLMK